MPTDTCRTGDPMVDDPDVFHAYDKLWKMSLSDGEERGGWIVAELGGGYRLVPYQQAEYLPCGININEAPPPGTVSFVHTHPWPLFQVNPCGFLNTGTPSAEDIAALQQLGFAKGYFLDANGIGMFTGSSGEVANRKPRCGY